MSHNFKMGNAHGSTGSPNIVTRDEWGARAANTAPLTNPPVSSVVIHHTAGPTCTDTKSCSAIVKSVQNHHMDNRKWNDIGYNFLVGGNGEVYEGRGFGQQGAHATGMNDKSVGISFMGDYSKEAPSKAMQDAAKQLISSGVAAGHISADYNIVGHNQVKKTECPGKAFSDEIKGWKKP